MSVAAGAYPWRRRLIAATPYLVLLVANAVYRLPPLLNAAGVNSDAAIAGLQAMHLLNGETSRFLWGAGYQGTFEVWVIAAFFWIGGPTPLALMLAPMAGHLLLSFAVFAMLARLLRQRASAFVVCLLLVFTPQAVNGVVTSSPRQWSVTLAVCSAILMAWPARRAPLRLAVGLGLVAVALSLDLFNVLWLPAIGLLVLLMCCDPSLDNTAVDGRFVGTAAGAVTGGLLLVSLRAGAPQDHAAFDFGVQFLDRNWPLLRDVSLPWLLGAKVWMPGWNVFPDLWSPPGLVRAVQWIGAVSIVPLVIVSGWLTSRPRVSWELKAAVWFGLTAAATALGGFLLSNWPVDLWSTRYLAPIVWSLPFSLAALAGAVRPRTLAGLLAPYLVVAAVGGWLGYGSYVDGLLPRLDDRGSGRNEIALGEFLRQRGYEHGYADYWLAHRLTFLCASGHYSPRLVPIAIRPTRRPRAVPKSRCTSFIPASRAPGPTRCCLT
jgi:hypothetical protein